MSIFSFEVALFLRGVFIETSVVGFTLDESLLGRVNCARMEALSFD
jgi:hypothetical protein